MKPVLSKNSKVFKATKERSSTEPGWRAFLRFLIPALAFCGQTTMVVSNAQPYAGHMTTDIWGNGEAPIIEEVAQYPDDKYKANLAYVQACDEWEDSEMGSPEQDYLFPEPTPLLVKDHRVAYTKVKDPETKGIDTIRNLRLKVAFDTMEDSWIQADALRVDKPKLIASYAVRNSLLAHPDFKWVKKEFDTEQMMVNVLKVFAAKQGRLMHPNSNLVSR